MLLSLIGNPLNTWQCATASCIRTIFNKAIKICTRCWCTYSTSHLPCCGSFIYTQPKTLRVALLRVRDGMRRYTGGKDGEDSDRDRLIYHAYE
jgi:hypothetical protein